MSERRKLIDPLHPQLTVQAQCELLGLARATYYYESVADPREDERLMRMIDEQFTKTPFYGSRRMGQWMRRQGEIVNRKRVARLMDLMGLCAIYPQKTMSLSKGSERRFPYLLRDMDIVRPNQVWSADITYVRLRHGFLYLVAIMDWLSRYVLAWRLSNTLESSFCTEALGEALKGGKPEYFNTDQGTQFTCEGFTSMLLERGVKISMAGKGRVFDNIFVERLWRTVKYEEVYLHDYEDGSDAHAGLARFFDFYDTERLHQALHYQTPLEVYTHGLGRR